MPDGPLLIVEDDPDIRELVSETLADAGYAVEEVAHPQHAVTLLAERGPVAFAAVVARPFITPGEDRYLWLGKLRAATSAPIIITVRWPASWFADHRERGYAGLIQEPFAPAALVALVNDALRGQPEG